MAQQQGIQQQHAQAQTQLNDQIGKLTTGLAGISPADLMQRVQANVSAGNPQVPMASYALPTQGLAGQAPPKAPSGMLQYVPPPGVMGAPSMMLAAPKMGGPMLSYLPQSGRTASYVPSAGVVAAPATLPQISYVPQVTYGTSVTTSAAKPQTSFVPAATVTML